MKTFHAQYDLPDRIYKAAPESAILLGMNTILEEIFHGQVWDDSALATAGRFIEYLKEYQPLPEQWLDDHWKDFEVARKQLDICRDIEFASICKHHLLPFFGSVDLGYVPAEKQIGLSKMPRLVEWAAHRPQTQEALTGTIADEMNKRLKPQGVMVVVRAVHTCMSCRGVRKVGASMVTSLPTGVFYNNVATRQEFLELTR